MEQFKHDMWWKPSPHGLMPYETWICGKSGLDRGDYGSENGKKGLLRFDGQIR